MPRPVEESVLTWVEERVRDLVARGCVPGGQFEDEVEGLSAPLVERPGGKALDAELRAGDVVVVGGVLRAFVAVDDLEATVLGWAGRGVIVFLQRFPLGVSPAMWSVAIAGYRMLSVRRGRKKSEAIKGALAVLKAKGKPTGKAPYGYRIRHLKRGRGGEKVFVPDPYERAVGARIVAWKQAGHSWESVWKCLREQRVRTKDGKEWSMRKIQDAYKGELQLRAVEAARAAAVASQEKPNCKSEKNPRRGLSPRARQ